MNKLIALVVICSQFAYSAQSIAATTTLTIEEVAAKVKKSDFTVQANAERVYQSKEAVQVARMNLLPKLNVWKVLSVFGGWQNAVGLIEDLVPFLVPANWFRAKQQALFREAEIAGMRSLRANQIMTAKGVFLQAVADENLLSAIRSNIEISKGILEYTQLQEKFGQVPSGTSKAIEIRYLGLLEDARALEKLTLDEKKTLALMVGIPAQNDVVLKKPTVLDVDSIPNPSYSALEKVVVERSPEIEQFDYLYDAARYVKREVQFSILGVSSLSRGVMGGVFDQYPVQQGLGFGMGASVRIVKSQREQIAIQQEAAAEVLKRQLALTIQNVSSDKEAFANVSKRRVLGQQYMDTLNQRLKLGQVVPAIDLIDSSKTVIETEAAYLSYMMRLQMNLDKIERMKFEGDYLKVEETLPEEE